VEKVLPEHTQMGAWRLDVTPPDPKSETVYLHVLYPTTTDTAAMPPCALRRDGARLQVTVGELTYALEAGRDE
jgi:hypothetical protein